MQIYNDNEYKEMKTMKPNIEIKHQIQKQSIKSTNKASNIEIKNQSQTRSPSFKSLYNSATTAAAALPHFSCLLSIRFIILILELCSLSSGFITFASSLFCFTLTQICYSPPLQPYFYSRFLPKSSGNSYIDSHLLMRLIRSSLVSCCIDYWQFYGLAIGGCGNKQAGAPSSACRKDKRKSCSSI